VKKDLSHGPGLAMESRLLLEYLSPTFLGELYKFID
jgi:hypothetical protein